MTRAQAISKIAVILKPMGTPPVPRAYAEQIIQSLDDALHFDPEVVEVSANCTGVGRFAQSG